MAKRKQTTFIYQLGEMSLNPVLVDTLMNPVAWKEMLANLGNSYHLIQVENSLGISVVSLLELAHLEWRKGNRPHWSEALPFYGQNPV
jgi:tRNA A37 threonylcarbamoyladenosine modification protein TsaB